MKSTQVHDATFLIQETQVTLHRVDYKTEAVISWVLLGVILTVCLMLSGCIIYDSSPRVNAHATDCEVLRETYLSIRENGNVLYRIATTNEERAAAQQHVDRANRYLLKLKTEPPCSDH